MELQTTFIKYYSFVQNEASNLPNWLVTQEKYQNIYILKKKNVAEGRALGVK